MIICNTYRQEKERRKMKRNLDGVYFRIKREDRYESICFSDLTPDERESVMEGRDEKWLRSLCCILADVIKNIGDQFDIVCE